MRIPVRCAPSRFGSKAGATAVCVLLLELLGPLSARAAVPPTTVNYQGVLRDQNDNPLTGSYDVVLRFMDAATAGNEILTDQHTAATGNAVTVSGGLFNVAIGSGTVADGSGPGTYTSLDAVFRDYGSVWLEVKVGAETLSPRTPIQSSPYALNSTQLAGHPDSYYVNTATLNQEMYGSLSIYDNAPHAYGGQALSVQSNSLAFAAYTLDGDAGWFSGTTRGVKSECINPGCTGVLGTGDIGVAGSGGTGGHFSGGPGPAVVADVASATRGISTTGGDYGGYFSTTKASSIGVYASAAGTGVQGSGGTAGGYFTGPSGVNATLAGAGLGISATGTNVGGYFSDGAPWFAYTQIPYHDLGIYAYGSNVGGQFNAFTTGNYAQLAYSSYKILGTGVVSFVQNHPTDPSKVVVYVAPEGDEAAVYTRGSGRLVDGEARVRLGETFALVANPDIGLTATATPRGEPIPLAVSEVSPGELVVRGPAGSVAEFDYMVWGLRIGFEETSIVQPKRIESKIPSMHMHEQIFKDDPALRGYTALARYEKVEEQVRGRKLHDLARADSLRDAIGVSPYRDPAQGPPEDAPRPPTAPLSSHPAGMPDGAAGQAGNAAQVPPQTQAGAVAPSRADQSVSPAAAGLELFDADGAIEAGDVVSLASASPGSVVRSSGSSDPLVIGCAQMIEAGTGPAAKVAVATGRLALCRVDASYGAISVGDHLSLSPAPGMAIKADPGAAGPTVLGRAIDPLDSGTGLVRVLLGAR